jgi:hypothetical protein
MKEERMNRASVLIVALAAASVTVVGSRWSLAQQRDGAAPTRVAAVPVR